MAIQIFSLLGFMLLALLLFYPVTWEKWKAFYDYQLEEYDLEATKEPYLKLLKKCGFGLLALFLALISSLFSIIKSEVVGKEKVDVNSPEGRFSSFSQFLQGVMSTDWKSDSTFNDEVEGWNWLGGSDLRIHFRQLPEEKTRLRLLKRLESYGSNSGWKVTGLSDIYNHNFGDSSNWSVQVYFTDLIEQNKNERVAELARVNRESELDSLPIDLGYLMTTEIPNEKNEYPICFERGGSARFIPWSHTILAGATGSGKSTALTYLTGVLTVSRRSTNDLLYILDYKRGKDWSYLAKNKADFYFAGEDTKLAFNQIFDLLEACISGEVVLGDRIIWVVIDEFSSIVESFSTKKERDEFLSRFGQLLRLGRNLGEGNGGFRVIVGLQQADASVFGGTSTRGNFGIRMALGGLTTEGARMLFDVTEDSDKPVSSKVGKGFIQVYGSPVQAMMMPFITDAKDWLMVIYASWDGRLSDERLLE